MRENLEEEAIIMKDVPGWKVKNMKTLTFLISFTFLENIYFEQTNT